MSGLKKLYQFHAKCDVPLRGFIESHCVPVYFVVLAPVGGAAARAHANTILDHLKSYLEKCTRASILDRSAPMTLQENFANSFLSA